jgi:hypothetical protein
MAVGFELAKRTGLKLFHNHQTIEPILRFSEFGTPPFNRLVWAFRRQIFEEVAESELPGLIFTYVWAFNVADDAEVVHRLTQIFADRGARVVYVELEASQEERLRRNQTELRLAEKPFKRDVSASRLRLLKNDAENQLNSTAEFDGRADYLRIDNTAIEPGDVAEMIVERFHLARAAEPSIRSEA